jgi:hypothetical protein
MCYKVSVGDEQMHDLGPGATKWKLWLTLMRTGRCVLHNQGANRSSQNREEINYGEADYPS